MRIVIVLIVLAACDGKQYSTPADGPRGTLHALVTAIDERDEDGIWALVSETSLKENYVLTAFEEMKKQPDPEIAMMASSLGLSVAEFKSARPIDLVRKMWIPVFLNMKGKIAHYDISRLPVTKIDDTHAVIRNRRATMKFVKEDGIWKWNSDPLALK